MRKNEGDQKKNVIGENRKRRLVGRTQKGLSQMFPLCEINFFPYSTAVHLCTPHRLQNQQILFIKFIRNLLPSNVYTFRIPKRQYTG